MNPESFLSNFRGSYHYASGFDFFVNFASFQRYR